jgi:hypothetical protein
MTIGPRLTELAIEILDAVRGPGTPLETKLEAFKLLTAYHVGTTRVSKHLADEEEGYSIGSLKDKIAQATKVAPNGIE